MIRGRIIRGMGGLYTAKDAAGEEYVLRAKKKFRRMHLTPLVGDEIWLTRGEISDEHGWIEEILPRKTECFRPPVANVSLLAIVIAPQPEPDLLLVDKMLILAHRSGLKCMLIVNKTDLDGQLYDKIRQQYALSGAQVMPACAEKQMGLEELKRIFGGETVCFCGQSGVGKSTLLNALLQLHVETGEISRKILRGKNTTRHAELFDAGSFQVMDTPGFSLLEMQTEPEDPVLLQDAYPEFEPFKGECRFQPCFHDKEPGCAVLEAFKNGRIAPERVDRYHILLHEMRQVWRNRYD